MQREASSSSSPVPPSYGAPCDFKRRAAPHELPEWMDQPGPYAEWRTCIRHLAQVNRLTLAYRPVVRFLRAIVSSAGRTLGPEQGACEPFRIVDVGSGGGDTLRLLERWGRKHSISLELTGVDLNPYAVRAAREFTFADSRIRWMTTDALSLPADLGIDVAISSLFTHHLEEPQIVQFILWMERVARRGWFISDLRRSRGFFLLFHALAHTVRWHPFVRHDGPVSIRRSFREEDWQRMLSRAGVPLENIRIERRFPGRLCVSRYK